LDFYDLPGQDQWQTCTLLDKGWSNDTKYVITTKTEDQRLLRISAGSEYLRKAEEYQVLVRLSKLNLPISRPIDFGYCRNQTQVYTLLTWMPGEDLALNLPKFSTKKQYELGLESGLILKELHSVEAPKDLSVWSDKFNKKIDRTIKRYKECPYQVEGLDAVIDYLNTNRSYLANRPLSFHHGDYHCGNMTLTDDGGLSIIDFNRFDYGDPWEEFNRIVWDVALSHAFANGRLHGYFNGEPPDLFFRLLALYVGNNILASIPWAMSFDQKELEVMQDQAKAVLKWYDGYKTYYPSWYRVANSTQ